MRNIANKIETLRTAKAESRITLSKETIQILREGKAPKGDPLPLARAAAIMAAKKTSDLIPYCHPILVDHIGVDFAFSPSPQPSPARGEGTQLVPPPLMGGGEGEGVHSIIITTEVTAVAKTGVEMEALTAASVAALTIYDMLKPIDKEIEIVRTRLLEKKGGKSSFQNFVPQGFKAAIIVTSDGTASGQRVDRSGRLIKEQLTNLGIENLEYVVLPDDRIKIRNELLRLCESHYSLILTTGGTGLGPHDVTVEAAREVIEREVPGIAEAMRSFGQQRTPYAMLSRGVAGIRGKTLIVTLPGSSKGVEESMGAIFPALLHVYPIADGGGHENLLPQIFPEERKT